MTNRLIDSSKPDYATWEEHMAESEVKQMTRKLFGTDGVRGVANVDPMTGELAMQLGRAIAHLFKEVKGKAPDRGGKGYPAFRIYAGDGSGLRHLLHGSGCDAGGTLPTPGIAFITTSMRANAGVVISASHNPYYDNGIKIFSRDGFKLPDEMEHRIEELILSNHLNSLRPTASEVGKAHRIDDAIGRYVVFLKNTFPNDSDIGWASHCLGLCQWRCLPSRTYGPRGTGGRGDPDRGRTQWREYQCRIVAPFTRK